MLNEIATLWRNDKLSEDDKQLIAESEDYIAPLLIAQAKGRWIEKEIKRRMGKQHPGQYEWPISGPSMFDTKNKKKYEITAKSEANMFTTGCRPSLINELYRFVTY